MAVMTPLEARTRLAHRIAAMAMAAFLRGLKVEAVQAFGFRDDISIQGLRSPAILLQQDASYELKEPVVMERGMLEMAALVGLARYLGVDDPFSLGVEHNKNLKIFARILEPDPGKAMRLLERMRNEAAEIVNNNWYQITTTAKAMVKKGRVEGDALVEMLAFGRTQSPTKKGPGAKAYGPDGDGLHPNSARADFFV